MVYVDFIFSNFCKFYFSGSGYDKFYFPTSALLASVVTEYETGEGKMRMAHD